MSKIIPIGPHAYAAGETKSPWINFLPIVLCPYCKKPNRAAVSGWGGIVSRRSKKCKYCKREFMFKVTTEGIEL